MQDIQTFIRRKYPQEVISNAQRYRVVPSQESLDKNLYFSDRYITVVETSNLVFIDQRADNSMSVWLPIAISGAITVIILAVTQVFPLADVGIGFEWYFPYVFIIAYFFIVFLGVYGTTLLERHPINIKSYNKEWVTKEKYGSYLKLKINSPQKLRKEINNIQYQGQRKAGQTNIYNIITLRDEGEKGTYIEYTLELQENSFSL